MDEYAAGRTPNPCLRCNEKIKFAAVLDRALALGFDAVATGHYAQLRTGADGLIEMHRADRPRQGPVLRPRRARPAAAARTRSSRSATPTKPAVRREAERARAAGRRQARLPRHLLRRRRRQRRLAAREARRPRAQPRRRHRRRRRPARRSAATTGTYGFTIGQRRGLRLGTPAADGKPRFVLDIEPVSGTVTVGPRERLAVDHIDGIRPRWCGTVPGAGRRHRAAARPRRRAPGRGRRRRRPRHHRPARPGRGHRARPGRGRSTTAPGSSAPPPSSRTRAVVPA